MGGTLTRWMQVGAAVPGRSHVDASIPCQDSVHHRQTNGVSVIALGDGAGSRPLSQHGSRTITEATCEFLCSNFYEVVSLPLDAVQDTLCSHLFKSLSDTADAVHGTPGDLASTLLFVGTSGDSTIVGHIGDGVIVGLSKDGMELVSLPERGEFANHTLFFGGPETWTNLRIQRFASRKHSGYALMSDGAADSLYQRQSGAIAPAVRQMADWLLDHPASVVESAIHENLSDVIRQRTFDDCSLGIMHRIAIDTDVLEEMPWDFRKEFLEATNGIDAKNRLRVLYRLVMQDSESSTNDDIALSQATIRRHLGVIRSQGITPAPHLDPCI